MANLWEIIGISSLIASVITVSLGIIRDVIIERYRFKRKSEAGYVQKQLNLYFKIMYILSRPAIGENTQKFPMSPISDDIREFNKELLNNSYLLDRKIVEGWLRLMRLSHQGLKTTEEERETIIDEMASEIQNLKDEIKEITNDKLIPKYQEFVGDTVPLL